VAALGIGFVVVTTLALVGPWLAYQRLWEPPGDRLLKWHLAGVTDPDPRLFPGILVDEYQRIGAGEALATRVTNTRYLLEGDFLSSFVFRADGSLERRVADAVMVGLAVRAGLVLAAIALVLAVIDRSRGRRLLTGARRDVLVWCALTTVAWVALMFLPRSTALYQGSPAMPLAFVAVTAAIVAERAPRLFVAVAAWQAAWFVTTWLPGPDDAPLSGAAALVLLAGLAVLVPLIGQIGGRSATAVGPDESPSPSEVARPRPASVPVEV
jgi:hypothetical protein